MWCILQPPAQQSLPIQGHRLHVSHNQLEPAFKNAGAEETCDRRYLLCSVPRLRCLQQKRAGECVAAGGDGPLARGAAGTRPGARHLPPTRLLRAPERAPDGIYSASVIYLRSQWGCLGGPKFVGIPDHCRDPSVAELDSRTLGPVQTLYESLNRFISLGGNDHINRRQTGSGREIRVTSRCKYHCGSNMKESESRGRNNSF